VGLFSAINYKIMFLKKKKKNLPTVNNFNYIQVISQKIMSMKLAHDPAVIYKNVVLNLYIKYFPLFHVCLETTYLAETENFLLKVL